MEHLGQEPVIFAANHVDWLDGLLLAIAVWSYTKRKMTFLARANNWGIFGQTNIVMTDDVDAAMQQLLGSLHGGDSIGFFPEGYRNPSAELAKGKRGAIRFALLSGAPVIPVGIRAASGRTMLHSFLHLMREPVSITFGEPRRYTASGDHQNDKQLQDRLTQTLMESISALSEKTYPYTRI